MVGSYLAYHFILQVFFNIFKVASLHFTLSWLDPVSIGENHRPVLLVL